MEKQGMGNWERLGKWFGEWVWVFWEMDQGIIQGVTLLIHWGILREHLKKFLRERIFQGNVAPMI